MKTLTAKAEYPRKKQTLTAKIESRMVVPVVVQVRGVAL